MNLKTLVLRGLAILALMASAFCMWMAWTHYLLPYNEEGLYTNPDTEEVYDRDEISGYVVMAISTLGISLSALAWSRRTSLKTVSGS